MADLAKVVENARKPRQQADSRATCQFIAGEPSMDDDCKCGRPTAGGSYCELHRLFCTMPATPFNLRAALAGVSRAVEPRDEDSDGDPFGCWPIGETPWTDSY